jgi:hypothetical protein
MKKLFKIILIIFAIVTGVAAGGFVLAQSDPMNVQFETNPLFQDGDVKPCHTVTKWIKVTNLSGAIADASISAGNFADPLPENDLARVMMILIKEGSTNLYGPALLADFYENGQTSLSQIADNATTQYDVTIYLTCEKGNAWQKKTTSFDLVVRLAGEGAPAGTGINAVLVSDGGAGGGNGPLAQSDAFNDWLKEQRQNQSGQETFTGSAISLASYDDDQSIIGQVLGESVFAPLSEVLASTGFSPMEFLLILGVILVLAVLRLTLKKYNIIKN